MLLKVALNKPTNHMMSIFGNLTCVILQELADPCHGVGVIYVIHSVTAILLYTITKNCFLAVLYRKSTERIIIVITSILQ